jgi:formate dehydrogenase major subunit
VEYEGGGEETRSNPWLAELQQENFVELNPKAAADRGIRNGEYVIVSTPTGARIKVRALVTPRVAEIRRLFLSTSQAGGRARI